MPDRFEDHRGVIQDLLASVDSVTEIFTRAGAVRGNHVHMHTTQWAYIVCGTMLMYTQLDDGLHEQRATPGQLIREDAGIAHAWQAETDCTVLVFTSGPRSGQDYESDTIRLERPLI